MREERSLAAEFAALSGCLLSESNEVLTFDAVVRRAVELVPACDLCSITLRTRRGRVETVATTDDAVARLEAHLLSLGEGPALDAAFDRGNVVVQDVSRDLRWPQWAREAAATGIRSAMAVRLHTATETLGALNLYSLRPGAFDAEAVDIAIIFAAHATAAMSKARLVTGLHAALESRHTIGMAQGVLAMRYDISYERAFEVLHRYSNDNNVRLRDVAEIVVEQRRLPGTTEPAEQKVDLA